MIRAGGLALGVMGLFSLEKRGCRGTQQQSPPIPTRRSLRRESLLFFEIAGAIQQEPYSTVVIN